MKTSRREFLGAVAASPILLGMQDKAGTKAPVLGDGPTAMRPLTTGACSRRRSSGATRMASSRTRKDTSTSITPCTPRATARIRSWSSIGMASSCGPGAGIPRSRARAAHPQRRPRRVPLPDRQRRQSEDDPQPAMQAVVVKTTLKGEIVWKIRRAAAHSGYKPGPDGARKPLQPDERRDRAERRCLRRRRLRLLLHQPVRPEGRLHPHLRRPRIRTRQAGRAARHLDRYARQARSSSSPTAGTTVCSASRWTGSTSTSFPDSVFPATFTNTRGWSWCRTLTGASR